MTAEINIGIVGLREAIDYLKDDEVRNSVDGELEYINFAEMQDKVIAGAEKYLQISNALCRDSLVSGFEAYIAESETPELSGEENLLVDIFLDFLEQRIESITGTKDDK